MSVVENKRAKLLATALNNTAVAIVITAVVTPVVGFLYGVQTITNPNWPFFLAIWFVVGIAIHLLAQLLLGRLKP